MASTSYFGKMNSTLGSIVPLAMFILKLDACTQGRHWLHFCVCSPMCVILCFCNLCGQTLRLLASVYHHVNLQCIGESGGSVIVLLAAVWLFSDMLPHLVLS